MYTLKNLLLVATMGLIPMGMAAQESTLVAEGTIDAKAHLTYKAFMVDESTPEDDVPAMSSQVQIWKDGQHLQTIKTRLEEGGMGEDFGRVEVADANFDGHPDLLICLGRFGTHANLMSSCWLWYDGKQKFKRLEEFEMLSNPTVDAKQHLIFSHGYSSAWEYEYGTYVIRKGELEQTGRLIQTYAMDEDDTPSTCTWTEYTMKKGRGKLLRKGKDASKMGKQWQHVIIE